MNYIKITHFLFYSHFAAICKIFFICTFCILNFGLVDRLYGEPIAELTAQRQFAFAESLFENKDYLSAAMEFKKFVFFFPEDSRIEQAQFKIGLSLYYQKEYESALAQFKSVVGQYGLTETGIQSGLFVSRCYIGLKNFDSAVNNMVSLLDRTGDEKIHNKIYYLLGWIYIESGHFQQAQSSFQKLKTKDQLKYPIDSILQETDHYKNIPTKNPVLAGSLSIFPGGGYLYCQRYKDAFISLIINSACAGAAYESFDKDLNVMGGIITAIGLGFYGGNIYGSVSSAYKHNKTATDEFINTLKNRFNIDLIAGFDSDGVTVKIRHDF